MFGKGIQTPIIRLLIPLPTIPLPSNRGDPLKNSSVSFGKVLGRDSSGCNAWNADVQIGRSSRTRLDGSGPFNLISPARWMAESTARPNNFQRLMPLMERFAL
jgi:hypothetical protein